TQHNTPDGGIPTIGLPGYSAPSAGTAALNHSGKVDTQRIVCILIICMFTQHNTPDGGIPTIGLPGYSAPSAGTAALNHSG
ncbi:hypothetical protein KXZ74_25840, partial [Escherichia coli]|nr:hypothetical protein [Escherichia coli]